ncbi:MAG: GAF domain-containing protein [Ardenticatenaceae bacterium]|nr:GAF domain-containing protein [Ardenticatenaceae bacterium]
MKLRASLAWGFFIVSAIVLAIAGTFQIAYNYQNQREIVFAQQQLIAQDAASEVSNFIEDKFNVLETAVSLENVAAVSPEDQERILGNALGFQPAFRQLALFDADGQLLVHSTRLVAERSQQFLTGTQNILGDIAEGDRYISPIVIDTESFEPLITLAVPIEDVFGDFQGVLAAELNLKFMWNLVDQLNVGETGYAYVVDREGNLLAYSDTARVLRQENVSGLPEVAAFMSGENEENHGASIGAGIEGGDSVQTFAQLGSPDWAVVTEIPNEEAFRALTLNIIISSLIIVVVAVLVGGYAGYTSAGRLAAPILSLTETASQVADGNLDLQAKVEGNIEIVQLADAFNDMTSQLKELIGSLEQRVAARTRALEISGSVSRQLSNILDRQELVTAVVELVKEAFEYYHAHIYLFDEQGENLVMVGGTGEAGQQMLANHHQIPAGRGLVGRAGQSGQSVLVSNTVQDETWLPNPLLPETKSEAAVPIIIGGQVMGVLDVQQNKTDGLTEADVDLLENIASQIAVGLRNANLYEAAQYQASREMMLNDINQKILKTTDVDEALQVAVREIGRALNASQTIIHFKQDLGSDNGPVVAKAAANGGQRRRR